MALSKRPARDVLIFGIFENKERIRKAGASDALCRADARAVVTIDLVHVEPQRVQEVTVRKLLFRIDRHEADDGCLGSALED